MEINELVMLAHENAVNHGFYEKKPEIASQLMLIVTELSEACEADRKNRHFSANPKLLLQSRIEDHEIDQKSYDKAFKEQNKDTFEDELSDAVIRICDLAGYLDIDLESHIQAKMLYNKNRPYKHGKEY
jgi:NTP pyrophosphatase (non-canonical NTP hydrolase)